MAEAATLIIALVGGVDASAMDQSLLTAWLTAFRGP
jgi:hypothetical protein